MIKIKRQKLSRLCHGDIIKDVVFIESFDQLSEEATISTILFPLIYVLTQDCELNQEFNQRWSGAASSNEDKNLISVLVAPLYNAEQLRIGEHLDELGRKMQVFNSGSEWKKIKSNQIPRYHFLEFPEDISIVDSVIDFKHTFSVSSEYLKNLKKNNFCCQVGELYRESVAQRFASFLSRIALPD